MSAIPAHLRRKRTWDVDDFAEFIGESHKVALARLHRFNAELHGMLLVPSQGKNRRYTFSPARLARAIDDGRLALAAGLFDSHDCLEKRVDELEDKLGDLHAAQRIVAAQTGQNTADIAVLKRRRGAAA